MMINYIILLKTHFWDAFMDRQLARLRIVAPHNKIILVIDETNGVVNAPDDVSSFRYTSNQAINLGLSSASTNPSLIWYNIDYPHYLFYKEKPLFDYYITIEYDVNVNISLRDLVQKLHQDQVDYLGSPIRNPSAWAWRAQHKPIYGEDFLTYLSCFAVFSKRAMALLLQRRLEMSRDFDKGELSFWPNNEAFIPNEVERAGYRIATLDYYGSTSNYDWWPPTHEDQATCSTESFLHPVLEGDRYLKSILHHEKNLLSYFQPGSCLRAKIARYDRKVRRKEFCNAIKNRFKIKMLGYLRKVGLVQPWDLGARPPKIKI